MILSMTGFGKHTIQFADKKITATIKSLNSKQFDLSTKISSRYRDRELPLRALVSADIGRGKVDFSLFLEESGSTDVVSQIFDTEKMSSYFFQLKEFGEKMGVEVPAGGWFEQLLRIPGVIQIDEDKEEEEIPEDEWAVVIETCRRALDQLIGFREQEGAMLEQVFTEKISNISSLLLQIEQYEPERIQRIKERIEPNQNIRERLRQEQIRTRDDLLYRKIGCK